MVQSNSSHPGKKNKPKKRVDCVTMMLAITGLAILHRNEGGRNEKREEQRKGPGVIGCWLTVLSCLLFFTPVYFFLIQSEENLLVLQDKEGKGKKRT